MIDFEAALFGTVNEVGEINTMVDYYGIVFYGMQPGISHPNRRLQDGSSWS